MDKCTLSTCFSFLYKPCSLGNADKTLAKILQALSSRLEILQSPYCFICLPTDLKLMHGDELRIRYQFPDSREPWSGVGHVIKIPDSILLLSWGFFLAVKMFWSYNQVDTYQYNVKLLCHRHMEHEPYRGDGKLGEKKRGEGEEGIEMR